jgi:galactokinase
MMPRNVSAFAPGRVNLIGEHTDYNQGLALPFAISDGVTVRARALDSGRIEAVAADLDEHDAFEAAEPPQADGWRAFVRGAVAELQRAGLPVGGAQLEISGSVPRGAGLSSSAALEVALTIALIALADAPERDRIELARICSRVENDWVGAQTGLLDQLASLLGERDHALRIDFRSLAVEQVALELGEWQLVLLDSGEQHANAASGYNQRRAECARACEIAGVDSLRDVTPEMSDRLPAPLADRARHVLSENQRVEATVAAIGHGDMERLGALLNESHASLRDCYEVSTAAVEETVQRLRGGGAVGARIMGGGFGGSVLGLMPPDAPAPDGAIEVHPGPGARLLA